MIGIIGAMDCETIGIKNLIENKEIKTISSIEYVSGKLNGKDVVCAMCNPGKVNSAVCAQTMILNYKPEIIINTGIAGSLTDKLNVLDYAVATSLVQHDYDCTALGQEKGQIDGINVTYFKCDEKAVEILKKLNSESQTLCGVIATGDIFVNENELKKELVNNFNAIACEMEGASIAHVCYLNNTKFAVSRVISDSANGMDFVTFKNKASDKSIKIICDFINEY